VTQQRFCARKCKKADGGTSWIELGRFHQIKLEASFSLMASVVMMLIAHPSTERASRNNSVKPPHYPSLWEACVNAILFQQVSLHAASTILRRLIATSGPPLACAGTALHAFPSAPEVGRASNAALLTAGLSAAKLATLRRVGEALSLGLLDETALQQCSSPEASARLREIKGIGPWTATVILLRGPGGSMFFR